MPISRNARHNSVWLPAPGPLDCLLVTECAELGDIVDNSIQLGESVFCRNPNTGEYELYTKLDARPEDSTGSIDVPINSAEFIEKLRRQGCPVPLQIRSYTCDSPGKNINGWDAVIHLRNVVFAAQTLSSLTSALENDDAVPTTSIDFEFANFETIDKTLPGYNQITGSTIQPIDVEYCDSPSCGACDGLVSDGCQRLYALYYNTVGTALVLETSADAGVTWTDITPSPALTGVPTDILCLNGRLFIAVGTTIYYNDTPTDTGTWVLSTMPAGIATSVGPMAAGNRDLFAIYDDSGILRSQDLGTEWEIVSEDGDLTAETQNDIDVSGSVVFTGGDNNTFLLSQDNGDPNTYQLKSNSLAAGTDDTVNVDAEKWNIAEDRSAVLYAYTDDATDRKVYKSEDMGTTWALKYTNGGAAGAGDADIVSGLDSWVVYLHDDTTTLKSIDGGCTWFDISSSSVATPTTGSTQFNLCPADIDTTFVISAD